MLKLNNHNLSKNLLFINAQLLIWLLFYPNIWKAMVSKIDSTLSADFALANLNHKQWNNIVLLRLLGVIYILAPMFIGIIVGLILSGLNLYFYNEINYDDTLLRGIIYTFILGIIGGTISGITISVAFSYIVITIGGLLIGIFFLIANDLLWYKTTILATIFAVSISSSVLLKLNTDKHKLSLKTSIFLFFIAILVASIIGLILYAFAMSSHFLLDYLLVNDLEKWQSQLIGITLGICLIFFWATRRWYFSIIISIISGIVIAILFSVPIDRHLLWNPVIGSVFNSFVFSLAFALPYLLAKGIFNIQVGIISGLLGSCGMYIYFFITSSSDISIIPLSFVVSILGFSHQWWLYPISMNFIKNLFDKTSYFFIKLNKNNFQQNIKELKQWFHGISLEVAISTNTSDKDIVKIDSSSEQIVKIDSSIQEVNNPYITGVPLTIHNQDLFVGRSEIVKRLELLLKNQPSPPILLYGQRRIGKSSLLNLLPVLLPENYKSLRISFQGPIAFSVDHSSFFYNLARTLTKAAYKQNINLPKVKREYFQYDPSTTFDEWLDDIETVIENNIVLVFDEFEALEEDGFQSGNLNKKFILSIFRDMIQNRSYFKIIFAGLHQLSTFPEWDNYFINAESVSLGYLTEKEAKQLIEKPIQINYTAEAITYILYLTKNHPALLQLICKEIIILKNSQALHYRYNVQKSDVEMAIPNALKIGRNFFSNVTKCSPTELDILHILVDKITLSKKELLKQCKQESDLINLKQSELIELTSTGDYRFQIELIRLSLIQNKENKT